MKQAYTQSVAELLRQLDASEQGLSTQQAEARLQQYGPNKLRGVPKPTLMQRFAAQLKELSLIHI